MNSFILLYARFIPIMLAVLSAALLAAWTLESGLRFGAISISNEVIWISLKAAALFFLIDAWYILYKVGTKFRYLAALSCYVTGASLLLGNIVGWTDYDTFYGWPDFGIYYDWFIIISLLVLSIKINQHVK